MQDKTNQAVVFTKPLHHLGLPLTPAQLDEQVRVFLEENGFRIVFSRPVTGSDLAERDIIKQHYLMYSKAACAGSVDELELSNEAKARFESAFGKSWQAEAGKVLGSPALQQEKGISSHELYLRWNEQFANRSTCKVQGGVIIAWLDDLDCYCINAFYPAMEENFYNPATEMAYHVVEFDPAQVSWARFRRNVLGATDASKAEPESFRGRLYAAYDVEFPGRDNFVHGSAGPLEGLVERTIHEPDFDMATNPVGRYLLGRGIDLEMFKLWKSGQSIPQLGKLFDATEEKDIAEVLDLLDGIQF
ncbi:MAG: hypothetical protein ABFR33_03720 [Verrucomicrobiota bacterium]